jgi:pimeloyl-ACP methyl ester carboxylesterase
VCRALQPDSEGFLERDGRRLFYELYGEGEETLFLLPTWSIVPSRHWKMQIAHLARHYRVLSMDGLGNGRSERCRDRTRYAPVEFARDCLAVMDATATPRALIASLSTGAQYLLELARLAPERVVGAIFVGPLFPYTLSHNTALTHPLILPLSRLLPPRSPIWWGHMSETHWRQSYETSARWFISRCLQERHSSKAIEDGVRWALASDAETLIATLSHRRFLRGRRNLRGLAENLDCPVLVIHGEHDKITSPRDGRALARLSHGRLEVIGGAGHLPHLRKPVQVNLVLQQFAEHAFAAVRPARGYTPSTRR